MELAQLQTNTKKIRNPFNFDFVFTWNGTKKHNKNKIMIPGDGKWRTVLLPLFEAASWHLYCKVRNQYHDEQVAKLREAGNDKAARKFHVSPQMENKIWALITGELLHKNLGVDQSAMEKADLAVLDQELDETLDAADAAATGNTQPINISAILEQANNDAAEVGKGLGVGESGRVDGRGTLVKRKPAAKKETETPANAGPANIDEVQVETPPAEAVEDTPSETTQAVEQTAADQNNEGAFSELKELE